MAHLQSPTLGQWVFGFWLNSVVSDFCYIACYILFCLVYMVCVYLLVFLSLPLFYSVMFVFVFRYIDEQITESILDVSDWGHICKACDSSS